MGSGSSTVVVGAIWRWARLFTGRCLTRRWTLVRIRSTTSAAWAEKTPRLWERTGSEFLKTDVCSQWMLRPKDRRRDLRRRLLRRRRFAGLVAGCALLSNAGCYEYRPYETAGPQLGDRVALELSDQGRASLGSVLGPGVLQIEGALLEATPQQYVL